MYHNPLLLKGHETRGKGAVNLGDKHQLWNTIVDKVAGKSLNTKFMHMEWDIHLGVVEKKTGVNIQRLTIPKSYNGKELKDKKPHSPLLDTTTKKYDPMGPKHPSNNGSLHRTVFESSSKRKAVSLEEAGVETNSTGAHDAKRLQTVSEGTVTRSHSIPEFAPKVHIKPPQVIPEVQFAVYNAEMLCAPTVIRQHTIGMLNEGQCQGSFLCAAANSISQINTCTFGGLITRAQSGQRP